MSVYERFYECLVNLQNGSMFDLIDSPKSFIATVQRLTEEVAQELAQKDKHK